MSEHLEMIGVKLLSTFQKTRKVNGDNLQSRVQNTIGPWRGGKFMPLISRPKSIKPQFHRNLYHQALYKWNIEEVRTIPAPLQSPYYDDSFFSCIKAVKSEGLMNIKTMFS